MAIVGWYDLWLDRHLVFRPMGPGGPPEDSVISWPMDPTDRATAYTLLIEAAALDADAQELAVLANHFGVDDADAGEYVRRELSISCAHGEDGDWLALAQGQRGEAPTVLLALQRLAVDLGYNGTVTFKNLCEGWRATPAVELPTPTTHLDSPMAFVLDGWTQYRAAVLSGDLAAIAGTREYLRRALAQCVELL